MMLAHMIILYSLLACLLVTVHSTTYKTRFEGVTWDDSNWRLTTTTIDQGHYQARASLANGYIGINVAALGPFFEVDVPVNGDLLNGWPLFQRRQTFATVAGFFDQQPTTNGTNFEWLNQYGGESVISGVPHWAALSPQCMGSRLNASTDLSEISGFSSTWDFRAATMSWRYTWTPPGCPAFDIAYMLFANKLNVTQAAVQLEITSSANVNITVHDILNGDCATRTGFVNKSADAGPTIWSAVSPNGVPSVEAYVYSTSIAPGGIWTDSTSQVFGQSANMSSISQSVPVQMGAGQSVTFQKYVGIASSDAFEDPQGVAQNASLAGANAGLTQMLDGHMQEWASIITPDSLDSYLLPNGCLPNNENLIEQQILAVTNPFSILQNTVSTNATLAAGNNTKLLQNSISVGGLTSESYAGLVFWDVEVWMQPGIVTSFPESMKQVANYRAVRHDQAKMNVGTAYQSSQNTTAFSPDAAIYSWTSGRYGNCTGTGPCFDYEYHINGDIALELENYLKTSGDVDGFRDLYFPIYDSAAKVYSNLLYLNDTTQTYMFRNATDPDEFANMINNPLFTALLIQTILNRANEYRQQFGMPVNETWTKQANNIEIPANRSAGVHLEYTSMNGTISVKQADVVLIYDLLNYQSPYIQGDLDYYAGKQSLDGPGMTYGVFSIVGAEASPAGCSSYTYDLWGSQPYARAPWFQYSEQLIDDYGINGGFHPAYPFLTGMGGANRVAIYGYLGLRLQNTSVNVNPTLPPQITNLDYRTFYWQGHAINATSNATHTTLIRLNRHLSTANPAYLPAPSTSIPLTQGNNTRILNLTLDTPVVLKNRLPHLNLLVPGNLAQCLPVTSNAAFAPGQFPLSAVDGAISTKWQPASSLTPASITIELGEAGIAPVAGFAFDWAQAPPASYRVDFFNSSGNGSMVMMASQGNVTVSDAFNVNQVADVVPYMSNTTNITLQAPVWGGRYARLTVLGNLAFGSGVKGGGGGMDDVGASVAEFSIIAA